MTVIAWDGKTLAADRRMTTSWGAHDTVTKIVRHEAALSGITGKPALALAMRAWWLAGAVAADFPKGNEADDSTLIVINSAGAWQYTTGPHPTLIESRWCAWGGGRDFAQAAMMCGKTAAEAVAIACECSVHCGNGIDTLTLESV